MPDVQITLANQVADQSLEVPAMVENKALLETTRTENKNSSNPNNYSENQLKAMRERAIVLDLIQQNKKIRTAKKGWLTRTWRYLTCRN